MRFRQATAVAVGVVALGVTQFGLVELLRFLQDCCLSAQMMSPLWVGAVSNVAFAVSSLLPGFLAGWIAARNGILLGFVTGLLGSILYAALFRIIPVDSNWFEIAMSGSTMVWLFGSSIGHALTGAAAGGAAQLLRSNYALAQAK